MNFNYVSKHYLHLLSCGVHQLSDKVDSSRFPTDMDLLCTKTLHKENKTVVSKNIE